MPGVEWIAIPLGALVVLGTFAGGYLGLRFSHSLPTVIALTGGIVVAVAIFDVLPEALELLDDPETVAALIGAGFLGWFLLERFLVLHHRDAPEVAQAHHRVGMLGALGLSVHSFIDGLGIGLAFGVDTATGMLVFVAVLAHDFADGLNTVSFVLSQSGDRKQAIRWLRIDAIAPLFGAIVGSALSVSDEFLGHVLALYAGFFLYLGATDLLPEAHHDHPSWPRVALTVVGFAAIFVIAQLAGV
jgi:zinc transporter, ZIP family